MSSSSLSSFFTLPSASSSSSSFRRPPLSSSLLLLLGLPAALTALSLAYVLGVEGPRGRKLLQEVRRQQRARRFEEHEDAPGSISSTASVVAAASSSSQEQHEAEFEVTHAALDVEMISQQDSSSSVTTTERGVAEVLTLSSQRHLSSSTPLFLMIPGNPGLVGFYRLFLLYLKRMWRDRRKVQCVSYVGHTSGYLNRGGTFSFDFQLAFMKQYVRTLLEEDDRRNIVLGGHSVGAYVCLQILDSLPSTLRARVQHTFMLFPTIFDIARTPNGRTHTPVLEYCRPVALAIVGAIGCLPRRLTDYILYRHIGLQPYEVEAARAVLQVHTVRNCLYMANGEMRQIGSMDADLLRRHVDSLYFIWGQTDQWSPLSQLDYLKSLCPPEKPLQYEIADPAVAHAFVVGGAHLVAPMVTRRMKEKNLL
jgi:pimeloyl-ACP methyl ester carboxylesterase